MEKVTLFTLFNWLVLIYTLNYYPFLWQDTINKIETGWLFFCADSWEKRLVCGCLHVQVWESLCNGEKRLKENTQKPILSLPSSVLVAHGLLLPVLYAMPKVRCLAVWDGIEQQCDKRDKVCICRWCNPRNSCIPFRSYSWKQSEHCNTEIENNYQNIKCHTFLKSSCNSSKYILNTFFVKNPHKMT